MADDPKPDPAKPEFVPKADFDTLKATIEKQNNTLERLNRQLNELKPAEKPAKEAQQPAEELTQKERLAALEKTIADQKNEVAREKRSSAVTSALSLFDGLDEKGRTILGASFEALYGQQIIVDNGNVLWQKADGTRVAVSEAAKEFHGSEAGKYFRAPKQVAAGDMNKGNPGAVTGDLARHAGATYKEAMALPPQTLNGLMKSDYWPAIAARR